MSEATITDFGQEQYLDGAMAQFAVHMNGDWLAFCNTLETARALANAIAETVIIEGPRP